MYKLFFLFTPLYLYSTIFWVRKETSQPVDTAQIRRGTWVKLRLEGRHERIIKSINMMNKLHLTGATSYSLGIGITVSAKIRRDTAEFPPAKAAWKGSMPPLKSLASVLEWHSKIIL